MSDPLSQSPRIDRSRLALLLIVAALVPPPDRAVGSSRHEDRSSATPAPLPWIPPLVAPGDPRPFANHASALADSSSLSVAREGASAETFAAFEHAASGDLQRGRGMELLACNVTAISSGGFHNLALRSDGSILSWGMNGSGQLGNGSFGDGLVPAPIDLAAGMGPIDRLSGGLFHSLALAADGRVWAWGENASGQLGAGHFLRSPVPLEVSGLGNVVAVAAGWYHSLALTDDGRVLAWGTNGQGQLGNGSFAGSPRPVAVRGLPAAVTAIAAGGFHSLALLADGRVAAWGYGAFGQLGTGFTGLSAVPRMSSIADVRAIAAGVLHSLAVTNDGGAWAWGLNTYGQIGSGSMVNALTPVAVSGLSGVVGVAAREQHSLAWTATGQAFAWGYNAFGQVGDGSIAPATLPVEIVGSSGTLAMGAGNSHSLALASSGDLLAWGFGQFGQIGDGQRQTRPAPTPVESSNVPCDANTAPAVAAGGPYVAGCSEARLDGAAAGDAEGGTLQFRWLSSDPRVTLTPASGSLAAGAGMEAVPEFSASLDPALPPCGVTADLSLEVTDQGGLTTTASTSLTFSDQDAPSLSGVPADLAVACDAVPPADVVTASDDCDPGPALELTETLSAGRCPGEYSLERTWTATDRCGNIAAASQRVEVQDRRAPEITPSNAVSHCLWPPNHQYVCFGRERFSPAIVDSCASAITWRFTGCASNQPDDERGDGRTANDCVVAASGASFCVRAERSGLGAGGRRYTVTVAASDACGNESPSVAIGVVYVPHPSESRAGCLSR